MASLRSRSSFFLLLSLLSLAFSPPTDASEDLVAELEALREKSTSGVIHLNDRSIERFLTSVKSPRPYSLVIFFDAAHLRSKADLHLPKLRSEFEFVSTSFASHHGSDREIRSKLFFCDIEFGESQRSFSLFGVSSLPHVRVVASAVENIKDAESMQQSDLSRGAESMAEFVEATSGLDIGPIQRPPLISRRQMAFLALIALISSPFLIRRIIAGETLLHDSKIWMAGAVFVYYFSVSGSMHNIIRNMPMFLTDREDPSKLVFFYQGSGMQLGAEGFAIGFLYTIVGLMMALVTHGLVRLKNVTIQRVVMVIAMIVSLWAVRKVIYLDNWKTGYSIHAYWPTSWR